MDMLGAGSSKRKVHSRCLAISAMVVGVRAGNEQAVNGNGAQWLLAGTVENQSCLDGEDTQVVFVSIKQVPVDGVFPQVLDKAHTALVQLPCNTPMLHKCNHHYHHNALIMHEHRCYTRVIIIINFTTMQIMHECTMNAICPISV